MKLLYLGGYYKSGTTWLKSIIAGLIYRENDPRRIEKLIPELTKRKNKKKGIYKVHWSIPPKNGLRIYIVRHPVDVCVSGINYLKLSGTKVNVKKHVEKFIKKEGNVIRNIGSWNTHVENWVLRYSSFVLKYENMLLDQIYFIKKLAEILGTKNVDYTLNATKFENMKSMELKLVNSHKKNIPNVVFNPKHPGYKKGLSFFNVGKSGYAWKILTPKEIDRICDRFQRGMEIVGYNGYESIS